MAGLNAVLPLPGPAALLGNGASKLPPSHEINQTSSSSLFGGATKVLPPPNPAPRLPGVRELDNVTELFKLHTAFGDAPKRTAENASRVPDSARPDEKPPALVVPSESSKRHTSPAPSSSTSVSVISVSASSGSATAVASSTTDTSSHTSSAFRTPSAARDPSPAPSAVPSNPRASAAHDQAESPAPSSLPYQAREAEQEHLAMARLAQFMGYEQLRRQWAAHAPGAMSPFSSLPYGPPIDPAALFAAHGYPGPIGVPFPMGMPYGSTLMPPFAPYARSPFPLGDALSRNSVDKQFLFGWDPEAMASRALSKSFSATDAGFDGAYPGMAGAEGLLFGHHLMGYYPPMMPPVPPFRAFDQPPPTSREKSSKAGSRGMPSATSNVDFTMAMPPPPPKSDGKGNSPQAARYAHAQAGSSSRGRPPRLRLETPAPTGRQEERRADGNGAGGAAGGPRNTVVRATSSTPPAQRAVTVPPTSRSPDGVGVIHGEHSDVAFPFPHSPLGSYVGEQPYPPSAIGSRAYAEIAASATAALKAAGSGLNLLLPGQMSAVPPVTGDSPPRTEHGSRGHKRTREPDDATDKVDSTDRVDPDGIAGDAADGVTSRERKRARTTASEGAMLDEVASVLIGMSAWGAPAPTAAAAAYGVPPPVKREQASNGAAAAAAVAGAAMSSAQAVAHAGMWNAALGAMPGVAGDHVLSQHFAALQGLHGMQTSQETSDSDAAVMEASMTAMGFPLGGNGEPLVERVPAAKRHRQPIRDATLEVLRMARVTGSVEIGEMKKVLDHRRVYEILNILETLPLLSKVPSADAGSLVIRYEARTLRRLGEPVVLPGQRIAERPGARGIHTLALRILDELKVRPTDRRNLTAVLRDKFQRVCAVLGVYTAIGVVVGLPKSGKRQKERFFVNPDWTSHFADALVDDYSHRIAQHGPPPPINLPEDVESDA